MEWHRTKIDKPAERVVVVGLWRDDAMKCAMMPNGQWLDIKHDCYCYTAPDFWIEQANYKGE